MKILLEDVGKRFYRNWLFQHLTKTFYTGHSYAITGPNGSGKSTLLQLIAGNQLVSRGRIRFVHEGNEIQAEEIFNYLVISAPYLELIEEFTLKELLKFHFKFKPLRKGHSLDDLLDLAYFRDAEQKQVKYFSSGMKQRLKLLLAFYSEVPIILLDEPTTNLDEQGIDWYHKHVVQLREQIVLVASNQKAEYRFCENILALGQDKGV